MAARVRPEALATTQDFAAWCEAQARALRDHRWEALDIEELADELDALSRRERRRLESNLSVVLTHLLKDVFQPEKRSNSRTASIAEHARRVERALDEMPSLRSYWQEILVEAYDGARFKAAIETDLPLDAFPPELSDELETLLQAALAEARTARTTARARRHDVHEK